MIISNVHEQETKQITDTSIIDFLIEMIHKRNISLEEITIIYRNSSFRLGSNLNDIIKMLIDSKILFESDSRYHLNDDIESLVSSPGDMTHKIIESIIIAILHNLFEENSLDANLFEYDLSIGSYRFKNRNFPTEKFIHRNTLVDCGFFMKEGKGQLIVSHGYEYLLSPILKKQKKMSIDELLKKKEEQRRIGEEAERFVIDYEHRRLGLPFEDKKVIQISLSDVSAGYDILSYQSRDSSQYDLFIEVKAINKDIRFFISRNEIEKARLYGERYSLYLVDIKKTSDPDYRPRIISNPIETILNQSEWDCIPASYQVRSLKDHTT